MKARLVSDENRRVHLNMDAINAYTAKWKPGSPFDFELTRKVKRVSDPARKYYYGVVLPCFLDAYYYERDEGDMIHRFLKIKYFSVQPDSHGVVREKDIPSVFSNDPTVPPDQRNAFTAWVIRKAAQSPDNPIMVPEPGE